MIYLQIHTVSTVGSQESLLAKSGEGLLEYENFFESALFSASV